MAKSFFEKLRINMSDLVAKHIATWKFVSLYTLFMLGWIFLHKFGYLHIDSGDFIKYNLFLSWAAGIQASIILMSSNRQTEKDRKNILKGLDIDKETLTLMKDHSDNSDKIIKKLYAKITDLVSKINKLEEIINLMEEEEEVTVNERQKRSIGEADR